MYDFNLLRNNLICFIIFIFLKNSKAGPEALRMGEVFQAALYLVYFFYREPLEVDLFISSFLLSADSLYFLTAPSALADDLDYSSFGLSPIGDILALLSWGKETIEKDVSFSFFPKPGLTDNFP